MPEFEIDEETRRKQRAKIETRTAGNLQSKFAQQNREELEEAERAMAPPVVNVPQCRVCQCSKRFWIERQLIKGMAYASIAKHLDQDPSITEKVDRRSIANHSKNHMPLDQVPCEW